MTQNENIMAFPSSKQSDWKARFECLFDQGKGTLLAFPFTTIREKRALLELYEAVPRILKRYPEVVEEFFRDADIAIKVAKEAIEEERQRNAPGDPDALVQFKREGK
jgi:hypothetical protein